MPLFGRGRPQAATLANPARAARRDNALTASGFRVRTRDADALRRLVQPWQVRAFAYYDLIPEIKYASQFYARLLSPLRLFPAEMDENSDLVETTQAEVVAALERIQDPGGGRTNLLAAYGRLMFLTGECMLFVSRDPETGIEQWEMLSTDELRVMQGVYLRYRAPSLIIEEFHMPADDDFDPVDDRDAVGYRLWQRHPRWSMLADSTMMGVLDLCEELVLLTQVVRARGRSRLAGSGILLVDDRISPAPAEAVPDEDPDEDVLLSELVLAMTSSIANEGSASSVVPLLVRATVPENMKIGEMMTHLQLVDPTQLYPETGLRMELVKRLAVGLDMPPEELLGMADANHWSAWQIDEQTWKAHGQQKAQQLCDDLTSAYLRPYLRDVVGLANWADYAVAYDATAVINHPDRSKDAKDLYDRRIIGKAAVRRVTDFDEDDAPTQDELAEMVGIEVHDASLAWDGVPTIRGGVIEPTPGVLESAQTGQQGQPGQAADQNQAGATKDATGRGTGAGQEKGAPSAGPSTPAEENKALLGSVDVVIGASNLGLLRAREAAGARLRSLAKRDKTLAVLIEGVTPRMVAPTLGRDAVRSLRVSETELVAAASPLVTDALRMYGIVDQQVQRGIVQVIERYAARTLYDAADPMLPHEFRETLLGLLTNGNGRGGT